MKDLMINGEECNIISVLCEFENIPIVFVAETESGVPYFCLCSETRGLTRWVAHRTTKRDLEDVILGAATINETLTSDEGVTYIIERDKSGVYNTVSFRKNEVDSLHLTEDGVMLDYVEVEGLVNLVDYFAKGRSMNDEERKAFYDGMYKLFDITDERLDL